LLFDSSEDKEYVAKIMEKIAGRAKEAMGNYKDRKIISGSIKELYEDLEGD